MRLTVTRRTVLVEGRFRTSYSITTDLCMWSGPGMDGLGRYLWRESELPDKDGMHTFNIVDPAAEGMKQRWRG